MLKATFAEVELEYERIGSGEPVLLISPVLADGFRPFLDDPTLSERHELVHYHRRGWVGSSRSDGPIDVHDHVRDAVAMLEHLGMPTAHVVGHSSGAAVAAQLAVDHPGRVHSLVLLELSFMGLPGGQAFLAGAGPVLDLYAAGEHEAALAAFLSAVSGLDWPTCRGLLAERAPGSVAQSIADADTFFGVELPWLGAWPFEGATAARITQPTLSVLGSRTHPLWVEVAAHLSRHVPLLEEATIEGVGHLLHLEDPTPVIAAVDQFLGRHPMTGSVLAAARPAAQWPSRP